jgi:hypothetical protein
LIQLRFNMYLSFSFFFFRESDASVGAREVTLVMFHALGKVLMGKSKSFGNAHYTRL